jgi:hypothetical protein
MGGFGGLLTSVFGSVIDIRNETTCDPGSFETPPPAPAPGGRAGGGGHRPAEASGHGCGAKPGKLALQSCSGVSPC